MKKLKPLTLEENEKLSKDMRKAQEILEPWLERLCESYGVKCKEAHLMREVLRILSGRIRIEMDFRWYQIEEIKELSEKNPFSNNRSPYLGTDIIHYI
jgi:hypothetical protein